MKIALIGASGYVGTSLLREALARGHQIVAIVRGTKPPKLHDARLHWARGDATDPAILSGLVEGQDVVISAFNPVLDPAGSGMRTIVEGVKHAGVPRFLAVGGAGSLRLADGTRVMDQPDFPLQWKAGAERTAAFLDLLRTEKELDWVFVSPAAILVPGERTGHYRLGNDELLVDAKGESRISLQDFAMAMLDEAEKPRHHRERFTVAY